ncbi:hypothetical protein [Herbinix luporum]|jgi:thiol:disulfide interchange protein|uniref:Uncharacterized protein n=1 Tax=Herbinix luporum TaxID=1679721 RepID=A0A0K8J351_9FIRM|nr:hypothetical protein [Herbinix luporum]MDI9489529.1 hypothetical protein [Bacillota bacterium]CUH91733.1 hypothetical protein SD1D_0179 [Herbinix luporum]HHT56031.1 hypothetical protein [Herbinix luporum]
MPTVWDNLFTILIFAIPFLILQVFFSTRKKLIWGIIVPVLWSAFGVWHIISNYRQQSQNIKELIIFYIIGNLILIGILVLVRYIKGRYK